MKTWKRLAVAAIVGVGAAALTSVAIEAVIPIEGTIPHELAERIRDEAIADARRHGIWFAIRLVPVSMLVWWVAPWFSSERRTDTAVGVGRATEQALAQRRSIATIATYLSVAIATLFACLIAVRLTMTHESRGRPLEYATALSLLAFVFVLPVSSGAAVRLSQRGSTRFAVSVALLWTWVMFWVAIVMASCTLR